MSLAILSSTPRENTNKGECNDTHLSYLRVLLVHMAF